MISANLRGPRTHECGPACRHGAPDSGVSEVARSDQRPGSTGRANWPGQVVDAPSNPGARRGPERLPSHYGEPDETRANAMSTGIDEGWARGHLRAFIAPWLPRYGSVAVVLLFFKRGGGRRTRLDRAGARRLEGAAKYGVVRSVRPGLCRVRAARSSGAGFKGLLVQPAAPVLPGFLSRLAVPKAGHPKSTPNP